MSPPHPHGDVPGEEHRRISARRLQVCATPKNKKNYFRYSVRHVPAVRIWLAYPSIWLHPEPRLPSAQTWRRAHLLQPHILGRIAQNRIQRHWSHVQGTSRVFFDIALKLVRFLWPILMVFHFMRLSADRHVIKNGQTPLDSLYKVISSR